MAFTYSLLFGTRSIPLVYNVSNQYGLGVRYGINMSPGSAAPTWHDSDDEAPRLLTLKNGNRSGFFNLAVQNTGSANKDDDVQNAIIALRRWVDGESQEAARFEITDGTNPVYLKVQRSASTNATLSRVIYGFVDDGNAHYTGEATHNNAALEVVVYLTFAPTGQAENTISLLNYVKNPNFSFESGTAGLAANWTKTGAPTVTLDTSIKLAGVQSTKIVASAGDTGIYSATIANTSDTLVCAYAWFYVVSGTAKIEIYDVDGTAVVDSVTVDATDSGGNHDQTTQDDSGNTWYRIPSSATITSGNDMRVQLYASGGAATFYVNLVYGELGQLSVPDSWASYQTIYGRNDQTTSNPEYINTFDVWGVPGDAPAVMTLGITPDATRTLNVCSWRDGRLPAPGLEHWYETLTVGAAFGTVTNPSDATRTGGAYYRNTVAVDDAMTVDVTAGSAAKAREFHRTPRNVWVIARSSAVAKVTFTSPDTIQTAQLQTNDTWELLKVYTAGGLDVNEDSTATGLSLLAVDIVTAASLTVDIDAVIVQFIDQNIIGGVTSARYLLNGGKRRMYLASSVQPLTAVLGNLWYVYPDVMNRFMFLSWGTSFAHTLTETFDLDIQILPQSRHLLGTI